MAWLTAAAAEVSAPFSNAELLAVIVILSVSVNGCVVSRLPSRLSVRLSVVGAGGVWLQVAGAVVTPRTTGGRTRTMATRVGGWCATRAGTMGERS